MSITTNAICNSFKKELLEGAHKFQYTSGSSFKLALYDSQATLGASTTNYAVAEEVANTGSYSAGGGALVKPNPSVSMASATAIVDFDNLSFTSVSLTARGALIYNTTTSGGSGTTDSVCVLDFGADKTATSGTFTVQFPAFTTSAAILRIA
jgi:hypothetical protein|tara:strand:+ start:951 stop:1406 length:456 start_codon:yes stop_codon:yes gene_type:complete